MSWVTEVDFHFYRRSSSMRIYSLFDRKLREYGQLVMMNNDEAVKRALAESLPQSQGTTLAKYPEDFDLMYLGEIDVTTGVIERSMVPVLVINVAGLIPIEEKANA